MTNLGLYGARSLETSDRRRTRVSRWFAVAVAAVMATVGWVLAAPTAIAASCPGGALTFVAHEDDDLIFINPDIASDIQAGRCIRTVFLTAGEAGNPYPDSLYRENGPEAAYAQMAGVADNWTDSVDDGVPGRTITVRTLVGRPNVSLQFLRLPDGFPSGSGSATYSGQSLLKLWTGAISSIRAVDQSESYTRTSLISTIAAIMNDFQPSVIRTQDYMSPFSDADHSDHLITGAFVLAANASYPVTHTLMSYQGYPTQFRPENVSGDALAVKQAALLAASQYDPGASDPWVAPMVRRRYVLDTRTSGQGVPVNRAPVANAGVDQSVVAGSVVSLSGSGSSDPDGDVVTYAWTQTGGPAVVLSSSTVVAPTFTAPAAGSVVTFSLVVRDAALSSVADSVTVTVQAGGSTNVARTLSATATASTQNTADGQTAAKAIDGSPLGYPVDYSREWASVRQGAGAWIQLTWSVGVTLDRVVLYDRPNTTDQITSGTLTFSDGSSVAVGALANNGSAVTVVFAPRSVTWVRLTVDTVLAGNSSVGLAEFEAWGVRTVA